MTEIGGCSSVEHPPCIFPDESDKKNCHFKCRHGKKITWRTARLILGLTISDEPSSREVTERFLIWRSQRGR